MNIFAIVVSAALAGLVSQQVLAADAEASPRGAAVFNHWCAPCHAAGPGHPATASLAIKYKGEKPAVLEQRTDLTPDIIKFFVRYGFANMTAFRKTEITDADLNDLAKYLSSSPSEK
ncbi:MAG: cytochrome c [Steroidobacteraceae bacterium]